MVAAQAQRFSQKPQEVARAVCRQAVFFRLGDDRALALDPLFDLSDVLLDPFDVFLETHGNLGVRDRQDSTKPEMRGA